MAGVKNNALFRMLGFPQGVDNVAPETDLPMGKAGPGGVIQGALRAAENIDLVGEDGKPRSRDGYQLLGYPGIHSLFSHPEFPVLLAVYSGQLCMVDRDEVLALAYPLAHPKLPMSYAHSLGWVYYSNGFDSGRINGDGQRQEWALMPPLGMPTAAVSAGIGGLSAGTYQFCVTYLDDTGRESGSSEAGQIELAQGDGITLTQIPQPGDPDAISVRVYVSAPNGTGMYAAQDLPVGLTQTLVGVHQPGKRLDTEFHEPLPAGHLVRIHNGRHYVMRDKVLYWSEALHNGQGILHRNYLMLNARGDLLEGLGEGPEAGLFVAAGQRTYYLAGPDPAEWRRRIAHPAGAVPGSALQVDRTDLGLEGSGLVPYWLDSEGTFVAGVANGVLALTGDRFVAPRAAERAATVLRERAGARQLITALRGGTANGLAVSDTAEAEVWRDGVQIS